MSRIISQYELILFFNKEANISFHDKHTVIPLKILFPFNQSHFYNFQNILYNSLHEKKINSRILAAGQES